MSIIISKKQFSDVIHEIQNSLAYTTELSDVVSKYGGDYDFWPPNCVDATIDLLETIFDDKDEYIPYFIFELEFGDQWYPEAIDPEENNGETVFLRNADELYDFLIKKKYTEEA